MADTKQATEAVCKHCGEEIVQVLVGWVHYDSGNHACALYATPRTQPSQAELRIPDDLKNKYAVATGERGQHVFCNGEVAILIERIARLEGGR